MYRFHGHGDLYTTVKEARLWGNARIGFGARSLGPKVEISEVVCAARVR